MSNKQPVDYFINFSRLDRAARLKCLAESGLLTAADLDYLEHSVDSKLTQLAEKFVENAIGCFPLPLSLAVHFVIDNIPHVIPMAVEETSIVAAASRTAKWVSENGEITTKIVGNTIIGQIQLAKIKDFSRFKQAVEANKQRLIDAANREVVPNLVSRGGGVKDIVIRHISSSHGCMGILHVQLDPCDAMGANLINQVCEFLREPIQAITGEHVDMCILSNLSDTKLTVAKIIIRNIDSQLGEKIAEASLFAEHDPYRAATNNKGVLNGIDPILIATGNDWRAVEAGIHAYAAHSGQYRSITRWEMRGKDLVGILKAPIIVGTVGGVTRLHPTAQLCLRILNITHADELSRIAAAVGLVQNLGALRVLTGEGIVKGHMKLHIKNLMLEAGPTEAEATVLQSQLETFLNQFKKITLSDAKKLLAQMRSY